MFTPRRGGGADGHSGVHATAVAHSFTHNNHHHRQIHPAQPPPTMNEEGEYGPSSSTISSPSPSSSPPMPPPPLLTPLDSSASPNGTASSSINPSGVPLRNLCHCNYGPSVCELEDTCIKHSQAACFHAMRQEYNPELGAMEQQHLYGCAPLERGSDASHLTCNAWRRQHASPRSIACCYQGNFCNRDLSVPGGGLFPGSDLTIPPDPALRSPFAPSSSFSSSGFPVAPLLFLLFGFLVGLCLFLSIALPFRRYWLRKKKRKMRQLLEHGAVGNGCSSSSASASSSSCPESGALLVAAKNGTGGGGADGLHPPYFGDDSGSGSGGLTLVQRSIALDLQMLEVFARGRYGELRKALYRGSVVAVKIFYTTEEESWRNERDIYQSQMLNHEHILQYVAADILSNVESLTQMMLITDYHPLGSLYDYLRGDSPPLGMDEALQLALSTISGLEHLHNAVRGTGGRRKPEIAHRDIKSKNVLVKRRGVCCVADFGLAVRFEDGQIVPKRVNIQVGTKRYMAPELLAGTLNVRNFEEFKWADMYSFALVLWEILHRVQLPDPAGLPPAAPSGNPVPTPPPASAMPPPASGSRHQRILSRSSGSSGFASSGCSADPHHRTFAAFVNSLHNQQQQQHFGAVHHRLAATVETDSMLEEATTVEAEEGERGGAAMMASSASRTTTIAAQQQQQRAHALPFQGMVDTDPSFEQMRQIVCDQKLRPPIEPEWADSESNSPEGSLCALLAECWSQQPRSRHTALKVKKELLALATKENRKQQLMNYCATVPAGHAGSNSNSNTTTTFPASE